MRGSASRSSRRIRMPAAWWAAPSRRTGFRRSRSTRTWRSSTSWASKSATTRRRVSTSPSPTSATTATSRCSSPSAPQLAKKLNLPGEDAEGMLDGITFLRSVREENPVPIGAKVGVIGAGDTAMDCVRSAQRVGADEVYLIYRRTIDQMPADPEEIEACLDEGIKIVELAKPAALDVGDGKLRGSRVYEDRVPRRPRRLGAQDPLRRCGLRVRDPARHADPGDQPALGAGLLRRRCPGVDARGYIEVDPETFESTVPGVYAGGDVAAHGPSSIVKAAADGKRVANAIMAKYDSVRVKPVETERPVDLHEMTVRRARREYRVPIQFSPLDQRDGFDETVLSYTPEEAMQEATPLSRLSRDLQLVRRCVPEHGADDLSNGAGSVDVADAHRSRRRRRVGRTGAVRCRPAVPDRGPDRLLQRVRQLRDGVSDVGRALSGQAALVPEP